MLSSHKVEELFASDFLSVEYSPIIRDFQTKVFVIFALQIELDTFIVNVNLIIRS